jgi:hypothetical protein
MKLSQGFMLSLLFTFSSFVSAGEDLDKTAYQISAFNGDIAAQSKVARSKINKIEYSELTSANRQKLLLELDKLELSPLQPSESSKVIESANALLVNAFNDSKLVCRFETRLGSNKKERVCITAAAKKRLYEQTSRNKEGVLEQRDSVHVPQG